MTQEEPGTHCWTVTTQADLDEALTAQTAAAANPDGPQVCIHVAGNAEDSVKQWRTDTYVPPTPNGQW